MQTSMMESWHSRSASSLTHGLPGLNYLMAAKLHRRRPPTPLPFFRRSEHVAYFPRLHSMRYPRHTDERARHCAPRYYATAPGTRRFECARTYARDSVCTYSTRGRRCSSPPEHASRSPARGPLDQLGSLRVLPRWRTVIGQPWQSFVSFCGKRLTRGTCLND